MKTNALYLLASAVCLSVAFASCADDVQQFGIDPSQPLKQIVMTTQDFQPESGSRTVYQIADGAVACTWAANDTVGVFPEKGAQAYFPMASGAGTKNAAFDGEGWALKDGYTYASYYPYIGNAYLDRNAVPVSYAGQTQQGNASMDHLGDYDYMAAAPTAPEFGSAQFTFKHLSALVQLKISVPQPATLTSVKLVTDAKAFSVEGQVDIMADAPVLTPVTSSTEVVLNLQDVATTAANQVVTLYMMLPPADLSGQTLKAVVVSDKGTQDIALETKNFKAGTAYALSGEMESSAPGYKDGVVTVAQAGTMKESLGDNWLNITSLKVVGPINGDDVRCLRQMLGGKIHYNVNVEKGKLTSLDLSDASIVGGGSYYYYVSSSYYYTSNDVVSDYMFYQCPNLEDIVLPVDVTSIGYLVFGTCSSLTSIVIPDGVITFGNYTFSGCSSLASIAIPESVTSIGDHAFCYCSSLASIAIPEGVTSIGYDAFHGCSSLTSIAIPESVTSIGDHAFYDCSSLTSIAIPEGVTSIGDYAFEGCSSLTSIAIPEGVTSIGYNAFYGCSSLTQVYCYGTTPPTIYRYGYSSFDGSKDGRTLYVPKGYLSAYQSSDWANYFGTIKEMD